jgi:hypothetical protein
MNDAAFLKEAETMGFEVAPQTGEAIAALVEAAQATPRGCRPAGPTGGGSGLNGLFAALPNTLNLFVHFRNSGAAWN